MLRLILQLREPIEPIFLVAAMTIRNPNGRSFILKVNAATPKQPRKLTCLSIDIMSFKHSFARCFSQPRNCLGGGIEACLHRGSQGINITGRHQPTVLARFDQFGNSGHEGADHRASQRHGLHDHDGQTFGKARQHQRAGCQDFVADLITANPAGDAHHLLHRILRNHGFEFAAHFAVADQDQLEFRPSRVKLLGRFDEKQLSLLLA